MAYAAALAAWRYCQFTGSACVAVARSGLCPQHARVPLSPLPLLRADELAQNLGPVGPHDPILTTVGTERVIAFYEPDSGNCAVHVVLWNPTDVNAESTEGLGYPKPQQMGHIDAENASTWAVNIGDSSKLVLESVEPTSAL